MKKSFARMGVIALAAMLGVTGAIPAQAQSFGYGERDRVIGIYCDRYDDRDCRNRDRWDDDDYRVFYRSRRSNLDGIAAGIFGLTFGAILGSALSQPRVNDRVIYLDDAPAYGYDNSYEAHVAACYSRYRSYDEETDTFLGYDGYRHRCRL
ncbi:BA14K family protein [Devosia nitrariae]|uniref:Lectin-like protein BA14k n=1 Tax=Devosia nitrariae TaxID=2071872 RepID=A0ABQ5W859_9HYPH|nr:BA14K family protein [Devosia nitrariae]GLQ56285.1 hypothetical protein GCM10010862_35440 [Devosia nitrariae]